MTLVGVIAKLLALRHLKQHWQPSLACQLTLGLVVALLAQSACELSLYVFADTPEAAGAYWSIVGYYVFTFITIALLPFIATELTEKGVNHYLTVVAIAATAAILSLLLFTRLIIADVVPVHYSLTRVAGSHYWMFQTSALLAVLFTVVTLVRACRSADLFIQAKATNLLIAFLPVFLFAIFVVIAMQMGLKVNAVGILPLCMVIYVVALIQNMHPDCIPDYTVFLPWSKKSRLIRKLTKHVRHVHREGMVHNTKREYQELLIDYALDMYDGNQTKAAQWLKVSQSWISRNRKS
jgi:hypothetical protein